MAKGRPGEYKTVKPIPIPTDADWRKVARQLLEDLAIHNPISTDYIALIDAMKSAYDKGRIRAGLSLHALFDGVAIGSGFLVSGWLGWLIFLAILLHKAPEGFTMASVMLASGRSRTMALYSAVTLAVATLAGVLVIQMVPSWLPYGLPLSAGVALYVGASDLVPEGNCEPTS